MEIKKNPNANIEKQKLGFYLIGFVVTLGLILTFFNWESIAQTSDEFSSQTVLVEDEIVEITRQDLEPPKPEIQQQQQVQTDVIEIVEDDTEIEADFEFDLEADENTEISFDLDEEEEVEAPQIFVVVEKMPEFPGGITALRQYIGKNVNYPAMARENDIQGTVYVKFVVTSRGKVDKVEVARGVDPLLDDEALRVVKTMPDFEPGMQGGKAVSVWYSVPIIFKIY